MRSLPPLVLACALTAACGTSDQDQASTNTASLSDPPNAELTLLRPTIVSEASTGLFTHAIELESGTMITIGADDLGDSSGLPHALWRSTDGAASFDRLDPSSVPITGDDEILTTAEHDGVVYLFGSDRVDRQIVVWSSDDDGLSWSSQVVGPGLAVWGGIVGGRPTVSAVEGAGDDIDAVIHQLAAGGWQRSSIPSDGNEAMVTAAVERPDGRALAVGRSCSTAPDCSDSIESAETIVWASDDGGASWTDIGRLESLRDVPTPIALTEGEVTIAAIAGSDADGTVAIDLVRISPDGEGVPIAGHRWPEAEGIALWGVARSGEAVIAATSVDEGDRSVPHLVIAHVNGGTPDVIELRSGTDFYAGFGLAERRDAGVVVGVARSGDDFQPALLQITF